MGNIKIPYGISDYKTIREENYIYIDKTMYIEKLENNPMSMYVRPRRFGKSLFTSMLSYYYDIKEEENFEKLYKGLYIYENPTIKKNAYYILKFNFSGMNVNASKGQEEIENAFDEKVFLACQSFIEKYELPIALENVNKVASLRLAEFFTKFRGLKKENKIYVMIDEYDHFTNGMLEGNISRFVQALGQGGFVRAFYEVIKEYAEGTDSVVDRFFATGIAPLTLDSLTSGFNIAINLSLLPNFVAMCGLSEEEVAQVVKNVGLPENVLESLKKNYDGYRFSTMSEQHTFNATLVMYYIKNYLDNGVAPEDPVDTNLATTGNKINSFVNLGAPEKNYQKLVELITNGEVSGFLVKQFEMNNQHFDENNFLSLLFYQGYITIKEVGMRVKFCIPNYVSEVLYASYFSRLINTKKAYRVETKDIENAILEFGETGEIEPITEVVSRFLTYQSVRDKENFSEKTLKYVYSMFLSLSNQYYVYGEFPANQGFVDIFIQKSNGSKAKYEAIIELKYISKQMAKRVNQKKLKEEAIMQMEKYLEDNRLKEKEYLKKFVIIFEGFEKYSIQEVEI